MYINEVGNLSIAECKKIEKWVLEIHGKIQTDVSMIKFNIEMSEELKTLDQNHAVVFYQDQLDVLLEGLISKYIHLGHYFTYFGDPFSSTEAYQSALKLDKKNGDVITFIARNYLQLGDYTEAKSLLLQANQINSSDPMILYYLAECSRALGEIKLAEVYLSNIMQYYFSPSARSVGRGQSQSKRRKRFRRFSPAILEVLQDIKLWEGTVSIGDGMDRDYERLKKIANYIIAHAE